MKKSVFVTKASAMLLMLSLMLVTLTGCGKKAVTTDAFKTLATEQGYTCVDVLEQFVAYDFIREATVATTSDFSYQIEFYVLSDSANAKKFFESSKENFDMNKNEIYTDSTKDGSGYAIYKLNSGDRYMFVEYVDNTMIYANVDSAYQSNVEAFVKELKY